MLHRRSGEALATMSVSLVSATTQLVWQDLKIRAASKKHCKSKMLIQYRTTSLSMLCTCQNSCAEHSLKPLFRCTHEAILPSRP